MICVQNLATLSDIFIEHSLPYETDLIFFTFFFFFFFVFKLQTLIPSSLRVSDVC